MELIANQPIRFNAEDECCSVIDYVQLVDVSDITQFQIRLEPCADATNLVVNGAFNDSTIWAAINFSIADNQACANSGLSAQLWQPSILTGGKYYKLTFTIDSGSNIDLDVWIGINVIASFDAVGTYDVYGFCEDDGGGFGQAISFVSTTPGTVCISNVSCTEVNTNFGFVIKDNNGTIVHSEWLEFYLDDISITSDYFTLVDGYVSCKVNWGDFQITTHGCYTICLLDPCEQEIFLSDLCVDTTWSIATFGTCSLTIGDAGCEMVFADVDGGGLATATSTINQFVINTKYTIDFTLTGMLNASIGFAIDNTGTVAYTADGTYSVDIIADGDSLVVNWAVVAAGAAAGTMTAISVRVADQYLQATICSDSLRLGDYASQNACSTKIIKACNDSDAFGFLFEGTGFAPTIRVESQLDKAQYEADRSTERNSFARIRNTYFQRTKKKRLVVMPVPEYIHDFLSLLAGFDHFYIDGTEYVIAPDNEYVVSYENDDYVGSVELMVILKEQLVRNAVVAEEGVGCADVSVGLVDEETGLFNLISEDNANNLTEENQ